MNVSPRQLEAPGFAAGVAAALARHDIDAGLLEVEITESVLLSDSSSVTHALCDLVALGVRLVLDDFGTGFSSLGYLRRVPLHGLKLDRSFVDGIATDPEDRAICEAIIPMAKTLGLAVTAEGVETTEQLDHLTRLGCDLGQGWLFGRPGRPAAWRASLRPDAGS